MLINWWETLAPRERWLMKIGSAAIIIILTYLYVWTPFVDAVNSAHTDVEHKRELIQWMQAAIIKIEQLKARGLVERAPTQASLLVLTNQSARENHLSPFIGQIREIDANEINVEFTTVPFDKLMTWLELLWREYGIQVTAFNLIPQKIAGLVQVNMNLSR